jgi:hypothetical protein
MRAWARLFIAGGLLWFVTDGLVALWPALVLEIWSAAFAFGTIAGAVAGMRGKPAGKALAWLARYAGTFAINLALVASLKSLGDLSSAIAVDAASAMLIASLYLTSALWVSFLRPTLAVVGIAGWAAALGGYLLIQDQAALVMAVTGGVMLAAPGFAILRLLPRKRRAAGSP